MLADGASLDKKLQHNYNRLQNGSRVLNHKIRVCDAMDPCYYEVGVPRNNPCEKLRRRYFRKVHGSSSILMI